MTGITRENGAQLPVGISDEKRRHIMIHGPVFRAAIGRKTGLSATSGQSAQSAVLQSQDGYLFKSLGQFVRVAFDPSLFIGRKWSAKYIRRETFYHRAAMRVRRTNGNSLRRNPARLLQMRHHLLTHVHRDAAIIHGNNDSGSLSVAADGQRLGPKALGHSF